MVSVELSYYYGYESEQFSFYRIPKLLFTDSRFANLSTDAKLLYGYLRIIGEYPDPAAHAQVRENALEHPVPEPEQTEPLPDLEAEVKAWEAEQAAKKQAVIDILSDREKIIVQAMETAGFLFTLWEGRSEITFSAGEFGYPSVFKTWDEAYEWINEAQLKDMQKSRPCVPATPTSRRRWIWTLMWGGLSC